MKSEFKFKNIYNMTDEDVHNKSVNIEMDGNFVPIGVLTHIKDDYIYGVFDCGECCDKNDIIELKNLVNNFQNFLDKHN